MPSTAPMADTLPPRRFIRQSEAFAYLGQQLVRDAQKAGWMPVICRKPGVKNCAVYYARADVVKTEARIMAGEYPQPK